MKPIRFLASVLADAVASHPTIRLLHTKLNTIMTDQQHLDTDVAAMGSAFATVISELKAQSAAQQPLDFTKADAFLATLQAEAKADAPVVPADTAPASV